MKKFFKIFKILLTVIFTAYSIIIISFLFFSDKEKRYDFASHMQGVYLSQTMFEILKFQDPLNSEIYFEQSVPFNKRGDYERGFELLDKAVEYNPRDYLGYRAYMKLRFLRDFEGAIIDFDTLDKLTPNFIDAPWGEDIDFLRGEAYYGLGDYQNAILHFNKSISNQGEDWVNIQSYVYLGISDSKLENFDKAIISYNRALNQSEFVCEAHLGLAKVYKKIGETEKAKEHILKAEEYYKYKRNDPYNEFLNEIYKKDILTLKSDLGA
jgi:tetratricopeptide (TPR) repeat protein